MIFPLHFLICNLIISISFLVCLLISKFLKSHLTVNARYILWYVFAFFLILPFLPGDAFFPLSLSRQVTKLFSNISIPSHNSGFSSVSQALSGPDFNLLDYPVNIVSSNHVLYMVLWAVWIAGICGTGIFFLCSAVRILILRRSATIVTRETEPELMNEYEFCLQKSGCSRKIPLYISCEITSPVCYGFFFPKIIIPQDLDIVMPKEELRFIFLHELGHYKRRDSLLNTISCILQIIYWFNPIIWYGFHLMRNMREIACDHYVIKIIGEENRIDYGKTLIRYAEKIQKGTFLSPLSGIRSSKRLLKNRITSIARYETYSYSLKVKSFCFILFTFILISLLSPFLTLPVSSDTFNYTQKNMSPLEAETYFDGTDGAFVLYNMNTQQYLIYNEKLSSTRISPYSTYKIYSGLFALEEGIITPENTAMEWDGISRDFTEWNKDQTLSSAMENSVNWYFQNLDQRLGLSCLYSYYSKISYGNCDLSDGLPYYWASSLKISPLEQAELLAGFLQNSWGFQEENINAIKNSMFISDTPFGKLYGKTGTGSSDQKDSHGWFIGFVENKNNTYCFACVLNNERALGSTAAQITQQILFDVLEF